ncbi:MAG: histone deacetylase [Acidaminococcales bacterium]|jgi:acetoin utilization deacetylase AcuC-like enzyme/predicted RNA-binding Zn-ribbon protein involved in translation (DUF1610 family)|nr:histone deacetylase [Acidaminococcales bacterium]
MTAPLGLVFFPAVDWMISETHPERQERLIYTYDQIVEEGLLDLAEIREYKPRVAARRDIERTHIVVPDLKDIVTDAHLVSAGGTLTAADAVMKREVKRAFALVRPPGHHAMRVAHGIRGFCTVNIEAIMIDYLRKTYNAGRIAVVDTDVHHGDGTQEIFYHDPDTLFISFHQDGHTLYPGSGFMEEAGSPYAFGANINLPLLPETGDRGVHLLFDELIRPILDDFQPDILINSAGQDNHYTDMLASMQVTAQGYARLADKLKADIAVLEGGYSIEAALPYVNTGIVLAMAGLDYSHVIEPDQRELRAEGNHTTARVAQLIRDGRALWSARGKLKAEKIAKAGSSWTRKKPIYYDTDGIREMQTETAFYCPKCPGYLTIDSSAWGSYFGEQSAFIAVVWAASCPDCGKKAYDAVLRAKKQGGHNYFFVQDKTKDLLERI